MSRTSQTREQRIATFWARVDVRGPDECWPWTGSSQTSGYGSFWFEAKTWRAHRLSYVLERGPIPDGLLICHHCDRPSCVNPAHLFAGTAYDNACDRDRKGRGRGRPKKASILQIDRLRIAGRSLEECAATLGVGSGYVRSVLSQAANAGYDRVHFGTINNWYLHPYFADSDMVREIVGLIYGHPTVKNGASFVLRDPKNTWPSTVIVDRDHRAYRLGYPDPAFAVWLRASGGPLWQEVLDELPTGPLRAVAP